MKTAIRWWQWAVHCMTILLMFGSVMWADSSNRQIIVKLGDKASVDNFLQRTRARLVKTLSDGRTILIEPDPSLTVDQAEEGLGHDSDVVAAESNSTLMLPENWSSQSARLAQSTVALLNQSTVALLNQSTVALLNDSSVVNYFGVNVRSSYAEQPALLLLRNDPAHQISTGTGVVVADIDTGVDPGNPVLKNVLADGYNFVDGNTNTSEWSGLDQSTVALLNQNTAFGLDQSTVSLLNQSTVSLLNQSTVSLLNQSTVALLNQSTVALLNQSTVALLNQSTVALLNQSTVALLNQLPPAFGHGTMVAGLIHVVAPTARIQPLKAFQADGTGNLFDVVQAIVYAADRGANVINMSFSFPGDSKLLRSAINYARSRGVVLVSSVGNEGVETDSSFPAGYEGVAGIAATDNKDILAPFSNYGKMIVSYTAPGVGLVTVYPGGHYAMVNGTSFSSALVSGLAALSNSANPSQYGRIFSAMDRAAVNLNSLNAGCSMKLGKGRIDEPSTLSNMLSTNQ